MIDLALPDKQEYHNTLRIQGEPKSRGAEKFEKKKEMPVGRNLYRLAVAR